MNRLVAPAFSIEPYQPEYLEGMLDLHNRLTAHEPHIAPLTPDLFSGLIQAKSYFDPSGLFVALSAGRVTGWVHACCAPGTEPWSSDETTFHIRMLLFLPDQMAAGCALVDKATHWLEQRGGKRLLAFSPLNGYPFYRGLWLGGEPVLPYYFPQVHSVLEMRGYHLAQEELMMTVQLDEVSPGDVQRKASRRDLSVVDEPVAWARPSMRESWIGFEPQLIRAYIGERPVGHIGWVLIPQVAARLGAPCVNIWGLGVDEAFRRHGVASVLVAAVLERGYQQGARTGSVSTQLWNEPAQRTYAKFGFIPYLVMGGRVMEGVQGAG